MCGINFHAAIYVIIIQLYATCICHIYIYIYIYIYVCVTDIQYIMILYCQLNPSVYVVLNIIIYMKIAVISEDCGFFLR